MLWECLRSWAPNKFWFSPQPLIYTILLWMGFGVNNCGWMRTVCWICVYVDVPTQLWCARTKPSTYTFVCCVSVRVCVRVNGVCHRRGKVGVPSSVNLIWLLFHRLTARGAHALPLRRCPCAATGEINVDETDTNCMKLDKWLLYENGPGAVVCSSLTDNSGCLSSRHIEQRRKFIFTFY